MRSPARRSRGIDRIADPLEDRATDVEVVVFHWRVVAALVHAGADSLLHRLADGPVLPVDQIPELHGVERIEARLCDLVGLEQEMTVDARMRGIARLQDEDCDVIAGETQEEIRIDELALVAHALLFAQ